MKEAFCLDKSAVKFFIVFVKNYVINDNFLHKNIYILQNNQNFLEKIHRCASINYRDVCKKG